MRRLKARCHLNRGELQAIGTSATVSQDAGGDAALARFATDLFDELFEPADIIGECYREAPVPARPYEPPFVELSEAEVRFFTQADESGLVRLAERICGLKAPASDSTHQRLQTLLSGNRLIEALMTLAAVPRTLEELADALRDTVPSLSNASREAIVHLMEAYLLLGSYGDDEHRPLIRPKLHTFFHGVYDVGLCMNPACRALATDGPDRCCTCGSAVRPAALCRTCGQDFAKVRFDLEHPEQTIANDDFLTRIRHEGFYCNTPIRRCDKPACASGACWRAGSPLVTSTDCFKYASVSQGSACPSRVASQWFRDEPS